MINQEWESGFILWLQLFGDRLNPFMQLITSLGSGISLMLFIPAVYWSLDSRLGLRIAIFLSLTGEVNSILKQAFHAPRPFWIDPEIQTACMPSSFGMPSGHAQGATVWLFIAAYLKNKGFWFAAMTLTFLIGLSRAFLGVHFPSQIVVGWLVGGAMVLSFFYFENIFLLWMNKMSWIEQLFFVFSISLILFFMGGVFVHMNRDWYIPMAWTVNVSGKDSMFDPVGLESIAKNTGAFFGCSSGAVLIGRLGGYDAGGPWRKRLLRYILGFIILLLLVGALHAIPFVHDDEIRDICRKYFEYFFISFSVIFLIPLLLIRLKSAEKLIKF